MKKFKYLFVLLLVLFAIPLMTFAEDEKENTQETGTSETTEATDEKTPVNVYLFRGEGCPHCQEAEEWFDSIKEEYGSKFKVVDYETWYNEDNAKLMTEVAESRNEKAEGVPYIIVGNKSWSGFTESYEDEIIDAIKNEYEKSTNERVDALKNISKTGNSKNSKDEENGSAGDVIALLVILIVTGGICFGIYKARNNTN